MSGIQASSLWKEWIEAEGPVSDFRPDSETVTKLMLLYRAAADGAFQDMWDVSARLYEWLLTLSKRRAEGKGSRRDIPKPYALAAAWMADRYAEDLSLGELADLAGVTKHHFCKKFNEYYRASPIQYLRRKRVEAAARLLRQSRLPIETVAERCGFADASYFGKVFHRYVGVSPSAYRANRTPDVGETLKLL
ncbi:helix-turn-helix transcriptional regulator [Paenibacillus antri]|uniref:Helix-turn-helix transcriptional regulator n=1 Tax=Paenibacillus antri TaxID=2582848 RepID=A0A5R9GDU3_9BACL|nr:helix-turn-helix transcriptional regulator [Paenibacillus antri]